MQSLVTVNTDTRQAWRTEKNRTVSMVLTPKEFDLLVCLAEAKGTLRTRRELLSRVWKISTHDIDTRTVDQHVARLRKALGPAKGCIVTVTNYGYSCDGVALVKSSVPIGTVQAVADIFKSREALQVVTVLIPLGPVKFKAKQKVQLCEVR